MHPAPVRQKQSAPPQLTGADGEGTGLPKERPSRRALTMPVLAQGPLAGEVPCPRAAPASTVPPGPGGSLQEKCPVAMVPPSLHTCWVLWLCMSRTGQDEHVLRGS